MDALVGWLVQTGQIRPSKQVAEGSSSFPAQTYQRRDAHGLVEEALAEGWVWRSGPFEAADVAAVLTSKAMGAPPETRIKGICARSSASEGERREPLPVVPGIA